MTAKPWYKSQTILAALSGFAVTTAGVGNAAIAGQRWPTQGELITIGAAYLALQETIRGRLKAKTTIGKDDDFVAPASAPLQVADGPVPEPDFDAIAKLGTAESITPSLLEPKRSPVVADDGLTIEVIHDTVFKPSTQQSKLLKHSDMATVEKGQQLALLAYASADDNHLKITLDVSRYDADWLESFHPSGKNTWYVYAPHVADLSGAAPDNQPKDEPPEPAKGQGHAFTLPGYAGTYYSGDPIKPGYNFTWGEALHFDSAGNYRRPADAGVVKGILKIADVMQDIRDRYGCPIKVNSWYRDPATNARVGGASQSRHLRGDAVDFVVHEHAPKQVQADLDLWWGSRGGLASSSVFTHIDARGYRERWSYGF
jgi:hypothetical protein